MGDKENVGERGEKYKEEGRRRIESKEIRIDKRKTERR